MGKLAAAWRIWRRTGTLRFLQFVVARVAPAFFTRPSSLRYEDAIAANWETPHPAVANPITVTHDPLIVAWIMSPPVASSGGHQNLFRFIRVLEGSGHQVRIYLYSANDFYSPQDVQNLVRGSTHFAGVAASIENYPEGGVADDVDVIVASNWPTAYRSFRDSSPARRFYFIQDFEPDFYPVSSESVLAENTYRFGFFGITAGAWLSEKLHREYGMKTTHFDFGSNLDNYRVTNHGERTDVFFYARPSTTRRGFELGIMALDLVHQARPDVRIHLVGQKLNKRQAKVPFPHSAPGSLGLIELNDLYNRCRVGLVLSLSNLSLLPLELLSAGVIPVVNDAPNNRAVSNNPFIEYTSLSPQALADRMLEILDRPDAAAHATKAAKSVAGSSWDIAAKQFTDAFEGELRGH